MTKHLVKQRDYVDKIAQELLTVDELIPTMAPNAEENILHILEEDDEDPAESG